MDKDIEGDANEAATPDNSVDVARTKGLEALQRLSAVNLSQIDVEPADFEKDDDYNFHARSRVLCTPSMRLVSIREGAGWSLLGFRANSFVSPAADRLRDGLCQL